MKAPIIVALMANVLLGSAAYMAVAGILIIFALGNNQATKRKRILLGLLGVSMFYLAIYTVVWLVKHGGRIF